MVSVSPSFDPALIKGLTVHKDNPFLFDFIVDPGDEYHRHPERRRIDRHSQLFGEGSQKEQLKDQANRMIKYFFAALTIPDKDIWVNLSPYEKDRMIPVSLGVTAMGRDLLAQDYLLKQLTASLIYPQKALGKTFWDKVYSKAKEMYGTTQIPVNTFNKVWIVPQRVGIYEHGQTAFIVNGHLKVMLEEDYLSLTKHNAINNNVILSEAKDLNKLKDSSATPQNDVNKLGSQIIRAIILPEIEKEINEGKNFASLRQIFYAQALAVWFKRNLKQALLNQVYANKGTVKGIDQNDAATNEAIYHQYLRAYKKGVFNFIQEDIDPVTQEALPRKYFSGGYATGNVIINKAQLTPADEAEVAARDIDFAVLAARPEDAAMINRRKALYVTLGSMASIGTGVFTHYMDKNYYMNNKNEGQHQRNTNPVPAEQQAVSFTQDDLEAFLWINSPVFQEATDGEDNYAFKNLEGMGEKAIPALIKYVINHKAKIESRKWSGFLLTRIATKRTAPWVVWGIQEFQRTASTTQEVEVANYFESILEIVYNDFGSIEPVKPPFINQAMLGVVDGNSPEPSQNTMLKIKSDERRNLYERKPSYPFFLHTSVINDDNIAIRIIRPLVPLLSDENPAVQIDGAVKIGNISKWPYYNKIQKEIQGLLIGLLENKNADVRIAAAYALGNVGDSQGVDFLLKKVASTLDGDLILQSILSVIKRQPGLKRALISEYRKYLLDKYSINTTRALLVLMALGVKLTDTAPHQFVLRKFLFFNVYLPLHDSDQKMMQILKRDLIAREKFFNTDNVHAALTYGLAGQQYRIVDEKQDPDLRPASYVTKDSAMINRVPSKSSRNVNGGIDLSQQDAALHVERDANGGVKVDVDPALIARIEREGMPEVVPVIINMRPADIRSLFSKIMN